MIEVLADGSAAAERRLAALAARGRGDGDVEPQVRAILEAVRRDGDRAVLGFTEKFDGVRLRARDLIVSDREIRGAADRVPLAVRRALEHAHRRLVRFHKRQVERGFELRERGIRTGMRVTPLARAGVYVPGGTAAYPSSVLMNVVPAKVAGVDDVTVATPPSHHGIRPEVLLAAHIAGATRILRAGGAQAIGALAYGTKTVGRVDKIVGPGNIWVATAKRLVFGEVDIDMIAGPSEVLVIADAGANPAYVAADMLAQAEHDALAAAICIATSRRVAQAVAKEVSRQLAELDRRKIAAASIRRYGTVLVAGTLARAIEIANAIAPEHLELFVRDPRAALLLVRNAGAVFLGELTSEPLGDYAAGPNHVLPTGGSARFSSPLGVYDFVKRTSIIEVSRVGFDRLAPTVERLARSEGLEGHARAVTRRRTEGGA
jgi:histidinol dehydrogenase